MTATPSALDPKYNLATKRLDTAADQQMAWSRPNTSNPWAAQTNNPDGSIGLGFTGPLAGTQENLTAQALRNMGSATDFNQFNVGTGDDFRAQAISGAQGQMEDWLSPLQGGFDNAEKQRLLAAGFQEGTPQFDAQMAKTSGTADDLRSSIGNAAIRMGAERGTRLQGMDLLSKQQGLAQALRQRSLPMEQLSAMNGLLEQPGVNADGSIMQGAGMDSQQTLNDYWRTRTKAEQEFAQRDADMLGIFGAVSSAIPYVGQFGASLANSKAKGITAQMPSASSTDFLSSSGGYA